MILRGLSQTYRKKLLVEGDTHIEAVRKGQKYFTNSTSYRNIKLRCVKLFFFFAKNTSYIFYLS